MRDGQPPKMILSVLVGSRAHGLNDETSDYDYRGVYVLPTAQILSLAGCAVKHPAVLWAERDEARGDDDVVSWEIGRYLDLAMRCNPTILEVLASPFIHSAPDVTINSFTPLKQALELHALFLTTL